MSDVLNKQLQILSLLSQNEPLTTEELSRRSGLSLRSVYRYIEDFRDAGFIIHKKGTHFLIDPNSHFFNQLTGRIHLSKAEAATLSQLLSVTNSRTPQMRYLREKLTSFYDQSMLARHEIDEHTAKNIEKLYQAMREKSVVKLCRYYSHSSNSYSDRFVEPFQFLNGNSDVRCFEITTGKNKTFKVARMESVETVNLSWTYTDKHDRTDTDLFNFSGVRRHRVRLRLGEFSARLLREEYPAAEKYLVPQPDGKELLDVKVCSYKGVGRFVLGLFDDIEVEETEDFRRFLYEKGKDLTQKFFV